MSGTPAMRYARFAALALLVVGLLGAVGWVPTRRLAGPDGIPAMVAGCAISLLSAAMAGLGVVVWHADSPNARMQRAFVAMVVRLAVVLVFGVAAVSSGTFSSTPLLFWLATTYVVLLPLEVRLAILSD